MSRAFPLVSLALSLFPGEGTAQGAREDACQSDAACGYDPESRACDSDPRSNRQPPIVDQGILCYCDEQAQRCRTFRVLPVPCESDGSCAVDPLPRPHPVAASAAFPHERGRPCRDFTIATTCERTNLCTMRSLVCSPP